MTVTPLDIRRKEFDKAFRGYDPTEVDLFLKQVADRLEDLQEDVRRTEERTREAEAKLVHYEKVELALQEALESARESARRSEASAEEKARLIVQEAELRAERIVHDAERERYALRQDVSKLSTRQAEIAARLRGFLFSELEVLAQFQGDDPVGFIKLQPAGGQAPQGALGPAPARLEAPISDTEDHAPPPDEPPAPALDREPSAAEPPAGDPSPAAPPAAPPVERVSEPAYQTVEPGPPTDPVPSADSAPPPPEAPVASGPPSTETEGASAADFAAADFTAYGSAGADDDDHAGDDRQPPAPAPEPPAEAGATTGGYASAPDPPPTGRAVTGGWDLRSLVTGEERSVAASDEEREAIRRILDDLD